MATILKKAVRRQLLSSTDRKGRAILVTLEPSGIITFKPKGTRRSVSVALAHCMNLATIMTIEYEYREKLKEYQQKKKAGKQFLRKPRKPMLPYADFYFKALK